MKKTICLVSVVIFLFGCASSPEIKVPVDDSLEKLLMAKVIQCDFTKYVEIYFTEQGEIEVDQSEDSEEDEDGWRLLINISPRSDETTIYYYEMPVEDQDTPTTFTSKVQRRDYGIYFIVDVEKWGIATITVLNIDDIVSDYAGVLSVIGALWDLETRIMLGSCKVIE